METEEKKEKVVKHIHLAKKYWMYEVALAIVIIIVAAFWFVQYSGYKQLPGPLYGGDVYLYYAHLNHIASGGSVFESHQYYGEFTHYPWLLAVMMDGFGIVFGLTTFHAYIYFAVVVLILAGLAAYWVSYKIFNDKLIALLVTGVWITTFFPWSSNTYFNFWIMMPLIPLLFFYKRGIWQQVAMGLIYGACGLIDIIPFLTINMFLAGILVYKIIEDNLVFSGHRLVVKKKIMNSIREFFKDYWLVLLIGIPIAMLYWYGPIFIYHGQTPNPLQEYVSSGLSLGFSGFISLVSSTFEMLFPMNNVINIVVSVITLFGCVMTFICIKEKKAYWAIVLMLLVGIIGYMHPLITKPLLGIDVGSYGFPRVWYIVDLLFAFVGIAYLMEKYKKFRYILIILVFIVFGAKFYSMYNDYSNSQWTKLGYTYDNNIDIQYRFGDYIKSITNVNDVILTSHEEVGFAINSLTGRKVMFLRRTHSSPFVDINQRVADGAVIMYGNNDTLRAQLIKKYSIKYFYADPYGLQSYGDCLKVWDYLNDSQYADYSYACLRTDPKYEQYLNNNGIETAKVYVRLDIASDTAPKYDMIAIKPQTLKINLEKIQEVVSQNITYFGFYKVD